MIGVRRMWRYSALLLVGMLVASSAGLAQPQASSGASAVSSAKADKTLLYVSIAPSSGEGLVNIYDMSGSGQQIGQLADDLDIHSLSGQLPLTVRIGPVAVDQQGNVYVSTTDSVMEYPRRFPVPIRRYSFPTLSSPRTLDFATPIGITVGNDGTLYAPLALSDIVAAYPKNNTRKPSLVIPMPDHVLPYAVAVDDQNNVYIESAMTGFPATIEKCPPNSVQCTDLGISLAEAAHSLVVDSQKNLIVCDRAAGQMEIFAPGSLQPRVIPAANCDTFALNQAEDRLFVTIQPVGSPASVSVFDYSSGNLLNTISDGIPADAVIVGVAVSPTVR